MANSFFRFKKFIIHQDRTAMKVTTDSCFFGAWASEEIKNEELRIENALDIGAGTGLLSLMMSQKNDLSIDAVEIDKEASNQAKENIDASPWKQQIKVFNEDVLAFSPHKTYDCIISNPPFYENELSSAQQKKNIAHHSEQLTIDQVLHTISKLLNSEGIFFLMYPFKREKELASSFGKHGLFIEKKIILKQSSRHQPFRILVKGSKQKNKMNEQEVSICDEHQRYTDAFKDLLRDYYLYL